MTLTDPYWGGFTLRGEKLHLVVNSTPTTVSACGLPLLGGAWQIPLDQVERLIRCRRCENHKAPT